MNKNRNIIAMICTLLAANGCSAIDEQAKKEVLSDFNFGMADKALKKMHLDLLYKHQKETLEEYCLDSNKNAVVTCRAVIRIMQETLAQKNSALIINNYSDAKDLIDSAYKNDDKDLFIAFLINSIKHNYALTSVDEAELSLKEQFLKESSEFNTANGQIEETLSELLKRDTYTAEQHAYVQHLIDLKNQVLIEHLMYHTSL